MNIIRIITLPSAVSRYCRCIKGIKDILPEAGPFPAVSIAETSGKFKESPAGASPSENRRTLAEFSNKLSFAEVLKQAQAAGSDRALIFEDDAELINKDLAGKLQCISAELPADFGVCFLGCYMRPGSRGHLKKYSEHLLEFERQPGKRLFRIWGAHAVIFSKNIYPRMIELLSNPDASVTDKLISDHIMPHNRCFIADPILFFQNHSSGSDPNAMHGPFPFDKMESETLEYIKRRRIN